MFANLTHVEESMKKFQKPIAPIFAQVCGASLQIPDEILQARLYLLKNTEKLLQNFNAMKWATVSRVEDTLQERGIGARTSDLLSDKVDKLVEALSDQVGTANDPDTERSLRRSREALRSAQLSIELIERVERTLERIRTYPSGGETYYDVLKATYFSNEPISTEDLCKDLSMSKSIYFARRREAVKLFGMLLWSLTNPHLELFAQILHMEGWATK